MEELEVGIFISAAALLLHLHRACQCLWPVADNAADFIVVTSKAAVARSTQQSQPLSRPSAPFSISEPITPLFSCLRNSSSSHHHSSKDRRRGGGYSEHVFRSCCYTNTWRKNCYDDRSRPGRLSFFSIFLLHTYSYSHTASHIEEEDD